MTNMMEGTIVVVPSAGNMDDETFAKHMNLRHFESLGGLSRLEPRVMSAYVMLCYRKFHRQLHLLRTDLGHEHADD